MKQTNRHTAKRRPIYSVGIVVLVALIIVLAHGAPAKQPTLDLPDGITAESSNHEDQTAESTDNQTSETPEDAAAESTDSNTTTDSSESTATSSESTAATPEPAQNTDPTAVSTQTTPAQAEASQAEQPTEAAASDDFFADAAFVGNSLIEGMRLYSGLTSCDYYSATSLSVMAINSTRCITLENGGSGTIFQGLAQHQYGKIYILFGINEIGYDTASFIKAYGGMLDKIQEIQPTATIYIMSLTPVSKAKSDSSSTFNMTRVNAFNSALSDLAAEKGCQYLDICSALAGEDGYLPSKCTSDGIHFTASVYQTWVTYLRNNHL